MTLKYLLFPTFFLTLHHGGIAQAGAALPVYGPNVSFDKELHDYDTIPQGGNGNCEFVLTNVGDAPLVITNFQSSCGCVVPYYEKGPVMPGKSTTLRARYDTKRVGPFQKSLTLTTNAVDRPLLLLRIKGVVVVYELQPSAEPMK